MVTEEVICFSASSVGLKITEKTVLLRLICLKSPFGSL